MTLPVYAREWDAPEAGPHPAPLVPALPVQLPARGSRIFLATPEGIVAVEGVSAASSLVRLGLKHGWEAERVHVAVGTGIDAYGKPSSECVSLAVRMRAKGPGDLYRYAVATWRNGTAKPCYRLENGAVTRVSSVALRAWLREGRTDGDGGRGTQ